MNRTRKTRKMILDACCGSKMFWFDKNDSRVVFSDKRNESHTLPDISSKNGYRTLVINPNLICDFTRMPFKSGSFNLVIFDPPHLENNGASGWLAKKYGRLQGDWTNEIRNGFAECFRVLQTGGTMIFKWNEWEIPVSKILSLTNHHPLFGHKCGRQNKTHWIVFTK